MATVAERLDANPFFQQLEPEERALLEPLVSRRAFRAGEVIFEEGAASKELLVLERGLVCFRQHQRGGGEDAAMGTVSEPGAVFGISALVGAEHVYPHSAVCLEKTEVLALDGERLLALCVGRPSAGVKILRLLLQVLARRLSEAREQLRSRIRPGLISHG